MYEIFFIRATLEIMAKLWDVLYLDRKSYVN